MTEVADMILAFVGMGVILGGYFFGRKIRDYIHVMIPFKDPLSLGLVLLALIPMILNNIHPEWNIDPGNPWIVVITMAFFVGYIIGYISITDDIIYVAVHQIVERTQDIEPIVRYQNSNGQTCWQPQGMWSIFKTVALGIHNPLQLSGSIYRTRHVRMKKIFLELEVDSVDLAGIEEEESYVEKWGFKFKVVSRKYIPSPNCTDSPYDWIVRATEYEDIFTKYAELQVQAAESEASIKTAQIKGGAAMLNALSGKEPSSVYMEELGIDMESIVNAGKQKMRKSIKHDRRKMENSDADAE